jgi:hypothetical protein
MIRKYSVFFLTIIVAATVFAGGNSAMNRYIVSVKDDSLMVSQRMHAPIVRKNAFTIPGIRDAEIRLRKGDYFEPDHVVDEIFGLRYTLRLEPRGVGETGAIRKYHNVHAAFEEDRVKYINNELLVERYINIIELFERQMIEASYRELLTLYEDRIRVMDQLKVSTDFDLNDLIKAEKDYSKLKVQQLEEEQELSIQYQAIGNIIDDLTFDGFDTSGLISVEQIKNIVEGTEFKLDENNFTLRYRKRQFELAEQRYELEKAENRKVLSFIEFSYDHANMLDELDSRSRRRPYDMRNAYLVELGFKLPFVSSDKQDYARRKINFLEDKENYEQIHRELYQKMQKDASDIRALIKQYEFLTARENQVDAEASLKKYLQMTGVDPLVLLSIKENLIKNKVEKTSIYYSILRNFVYVLDVTGQVSQEPVRNCLSEKQEVVGK